MDIEATIQRMQDIWHFSSISPRESYFLADVWKRYNPAIIYPIETIRNIYIVHTKYSHSYEKMMLAYCQKILNGIERECKHPATAHSIGPDYSIKIKGLNYNFFQMDWAFEKSAMCARPSMPSPFGIVSNVSKMLRLARQRNALRQDISDLYCKVVFPALTASGASIWSQEEGENYLNIREFQEWGLKSTDILRESMSDLCDKLNKL